MKNSPGVVLAALFVLAVLTEAHYHGHHRNNNNNNNNNWRSPVPGFYSWTRNLGRGRRCNEYAYAPPGGQVVYGSSVDDILPTVGVTPASSVYDFSNAVPVSVIAPVNGSCFYSNTTLNLGQTIGNLNSINNTQIPAAPDAQALDGTAVPLSPSEAQNIFAAYPALQPVCEGRPIVPTYPQGAAPVPFTGPTDTMQVFTLNSAANVIVPRPTRNNNRDHHRGYDSSSESRDRDRHHRRGHHGRRYG